jgi:hypothetical protein
MVKQGDAPPVPGTLAVIALACYEALFLSGTAKKCLQG